MPQRSSSGSSRSAFRPRPVAASRPPPQTVNRAPPPAKAQPSGGGGGGSILGAIGSTIADAVAFGTGHAVAHRAVDAVMGPRTIKHETVVSEAVSASPVSKTMTSCDIHSKAFQDCVNHFGSEISKCQSYMDMLNECKMKSSGSMMAA
ncbi:hypothetical protein V5N11_005422 [Cardamine amara subsp. amara]|uniref:CHCH domain-containing protein n=1 Tax=Cardamine amara subsp. amara TaxID=228776 RepID=A0ABD1A4N6_CARAN